MSRSSRRPAVRARGQGGFALIEVLVAMLLFMLGILGLVGLQSGMTRAQTDAKIRADAAYLAQELSGAIWADMTNIAKYDSTTCASYTACSDWTAKVAQVMPASSSTVTVNSATGQVTIVISWSTPTGETHKYTSVSSVLAVEG